MNLQRILKYLYKGEIIKKHTKDIILDVALKQFSQKGYMNTSVRDIAKEVGITQSGLYNHFKNKDAILESVISQLISSAMVKLFEGKETEQLAKKGKSLLFSIATTFKLVSFDKKNDALLRFLMQELYKNSTVRNIYNQEFYQKNVDILASVFTVMIENKKLKPIEPMLLAHEFLSPLFFYQMQISLLKIDEKSTSSMVTLFEKHVALFWENNKTKETIEYQQIYLPTNQNLGT